MRISVVIPTFNSAGFIQATLNSVLKQSIPPDEILILDDGSTDNTLQILEAYRPKITVLAQKNGGVARARNQLCRRAAGDLIAFLDHDDLWHPAYLQTHLRVWQKNPGIVASFLGHVDFSGLDTYTWVADLSSLNISEEVIMPAEFLKQYNERTGVFGSASFICVSRTALQRAGERPFSEEVSGVDDSYLCTILPLLGPVAYCPTKLAAYRITSSAQSNNKLKAFQMWANIFDLLEARYRMEAPSQLYETFRACHASKRRSYAKRLMGAGKIAEARLELWRSVGAHRNAISYLKSLSLLALTFLPRSVQPKWPSPYRDAVACKL